MSRQIKPTTKTRRPITLIDIYTAPSVKRIKYENVLYQLLFERKPNECISHLSMPDYEDHVRFVKSEPYDAWFVIKSNQTSAIVGAIYITTRNEIGIGILKAHRGKGYAKAAISKIIAQYHNRRLLANINPNNPASICLFDKFGFTHIQNTYEFAR